MVDYNPLVSIGVPTYNRPDGLDNCLNKIRCQSYKNIEIIISDNCSINNESKMVIKKHAKDDSRIRVIYQKENIGSVNNFIFTAIESRGDYFMWAADDDYIEDWYVEALLSKLLEEIDVSLSCAEAIYVDEYGAKYFLTEGAAFNNDKLKSRIESVTNMIRYNYGNLVYGIYRKKYLIKSLHHFKYNEVAFLISISSFGRVYVSNKYGLYKTSAKKSIQQACWEINGGNHPFSPNWNNLVNWYPLLKYHLIVANNCLKSINDLEFTSNEKNIIRVNVICKLFKHYLQLLQGYKQNNE